MFEPVMFLYYSQAAGLALYFYREAVSLPEVAWILFLMAVANFLVFGAVYTCLLRPWDGSPRPHAYVYSADIPATGYFTFTHWIIGFCDQISSLKPAPVRIAQLAASFTQSQVLFAVLNLGIPDLLSKGPRTADQLASTLAATHGYQICAPWLDRLLTAAAAFGMLRISRPNSSWLIQLVSPGAKAAAAAGANMYQLNAVSAALVSGSPVCMKQFVSLLELGYNSMSKLSEGMKTGVVPFEVWSGGKRFWESLAENESTAVTFDAAMIQKRHIGGTSIVYSYPFSQFDTIIDVAGGLGGFTADVLAVHPHLKGIVLDQAQQIKRARELWPLQHEALTARVQLVAGDIFDASTIPPPPEGSSKVAYVLNDVLHNWPDTNATAILRSIRKAVARGSGCSEVMLLMLESTKSPEVLPCLLPHKCSSDIVMMTYFGDGGERDTQQFKALLASAGWQLKKVVPAPGAFAVVEAVPAEI